MQQNNSTSETFINNKTILITGGTGSFGNTVLKRLLELNPKRVIVFSRDEKKQFELRNMYRHDPRLVCILGDVRDPNSVDRLMHEVDLVFHAAALKQVPSGEFFPLELIKTNIIGSANVIQAAIAHHVKKLVILSTDKAVYPINVMGLSKALMEKIMIAHAREAVNDTVLCGVRYGNVMYSRGSVIPLFVEQIKQKKPLTVTRKEMTRFLLPLPYSVDLVLFALAHGNSGDIFVKKAPACTIGNLVQALQILFDTYTPVVEIGLRGGEKIHETLVSREELGRSEDMGDFYRIIPETQALDYEKYFTEGNIQLIHNGGYTSENTQQLTVEEIVALLKLLPEIQEELSLYRKQNGISEL